MWPRATDLGFRTEGRLQKRGAFGTLIYIYGSYPR